MQEYIGFRLHDGEYAIPILRVREIIDMPEVTELPLSPDYLKGVMNLRGSIVPVLCIKKLINLPENGTNNAKVIVISCGCMTYGVVVDRITGVIRIDKGALEPADSLPSIDARYVEAVAKSSGRVVVILNPKGLIPVDDPSLLEDIKATVQESKEGTVEVTRTVHTMAGPVQITEIKDAREFLELRRASEPNDPKNEIFDSMVQFMTSIAAHDYKKAEAAVQNILSNGQGDLFREVGKITRRLHDTVKGFRDAIDPRLKEIMRQNMPTAVDKLQYVIDKTEEAAHKTMSVVEKYILQMDELADHIRAIKEPSESAAYLKKFKNSLEDDLTDILTTQSFQDITGQTIKRVITLVSEIEAELVRLIENFGIKIEQHDPAQAQMVSQEDVDHLLKEFGF